MIGRALIAQPRVRLSATCSASQAERRDLPMPLRPRSARPGRGRPTRGAGAQASQRSRPRARRSRLAAPHALHRSGFRSPTRRAQQKPRPARRGLSPHAIQDLQVEPIADQAPGRRRDHDPAGLGEALQPRGEIGRVADDGLSCAGPCPTMSPTTTTGRNPDPHGELFRRARFKAVTTLAISSRHGRRAPRRPRCARGKPK